MADESTAKNTFIGNDDGDDCSALADTEIDRQFPRNDFRGSASATIYPPEGQNAKPVRCTVLTRDLSSRGFGIAHTQMLKPRQRVELELEPKRLAGEVLWCRQIQEDFYIAGCKLIAGE
jgi:hypothetical protein